MDSSLPNRTPARENDTWVRRLRLPVVSGKASAAIVLISLVLTGLIIIPLAGHFHLPPWLRVELLLGVWWLIWTITLARLLYSGSRVSDDHAMHTPRKWFGGSGPNLGWEGANLVPDAEGCMTFLAVLVAIIVAVAGLWFLIEIAIPGIAFLLYLLVRGMLARVANNPHGCKGRLSAALSWGCLWATVYLAPVALATWLIHLYKAAHQ